MATKKVIDLDNTAIILSIIFSMLKLTNVINWSWWWVLSPLWILAILGLAAFTIGMVILVIGIIINITLKNKEINMTTTNIKEKNKIRIVHFRQLSCRPCLPKYLMCVEQFNFKTCTQCFNRFHLGAKPYEMPDIMEVPCNALKASISFEIDDKITVDFNEVKKTIK